LLADLEPRFEMLPAPSVHADLAALAALAAAHENRATTRVKIAFRQRKRFADSYPERHSTTIMPRSRSATGPSPAARITRMISSTVGGSAG
jgi:hypothetical protein